MMLKIIYRNLVYKPLNAMLSLVLLMLSVAIISLLMVAGSQINGKLDNDLKDIDMVIGAKGSPLQLVLSAVYHVDAPTGNINLAAACKIANNPMIAASVPLAYGDSYKGYRILGTTAEYLEWYEATYLAGKVFSENLEVVLGATVAARTGLKLGDTFHGTHGEAEQGHEHDTHSYIVSGILKPQGSVIDQLICTNVQSVWDIHDEAHGADHEEENHAGEDHDSDHAMHNHEKDPEGKHDHDEHDEHDHEQEDAASVDSTREITAMLLRFRSPMALMTLPRIINQQSNMQAAVPTLEINRLVNLMGIGITALQGIALAIMLIAGLSVFVSLYNRLKERRFEHALMRSMGTGRGVIFWLLMAEGLILSIVGFILGVLLCRVGLMLLNQVSGKDFHFLFAYKWVNEEYWLLGITLIIGIFASAIPAIKAYRLNIAETLSNG